MRPGSGVSSSGAWSGPHQRGWSSGKVWPVRGSRYAVDMAVGMAVDICGVCTLPRPCKALGNRHPRCPRHVAPLHQRSGAVIRVSSLSRKRRIKGIRTACDISGFTPAPSLAGACACRQHVARQSLILLGMTMPFRACLLGSDCQYPASFWCRKASIYTASSAGSCRYSAT